MKLLWCLQVSVLEIQGLEEARKCYSWSKEMEGYATVNSEGRLRSMSCYISFFFLFQIKVKATMQVTFLSDVSIDHLL